MTISSSILDDGIRIDTDVPVAMRTLRNDADTSLIRYGQSVVEEYGELSVDIRSELVARTSDSLFFVVERTESYGPPGVRHVGAIRKRVLLYNRSMDPLWETPYVRQIRPDSRIDVSNDGRRVMVLSVAHPSPSAPARNKVRSYKTGDYLVVIGRDGDLLFQKQGPDTAWQSYFRTATLSDDGRYLSYGVLGRHEWILVDLDENRSTSLNPRKNSDYEWHRSCRFSGVSTIKEKLEGLKITGLVRCEDGPHQWSFRVGW